MVFIQYLMNRTLVNSPEVDALVSTIEIDNLETIVTFGADAAEEISRASDVVLNSMDMSQLPLYALFFLKNSITPGRPCIGWKWKRP